MTPTTDELIKWHEDEAKIQRARLSLFSSSDSKWIAHHCELTVAALRRLKAFEEAEEIQIKGPVDIHDYCDHPQLRQLNEGDRIIITARERKEG